MKTASRNTVFAALAVLLVGAQAAVGADDAAEARIKKMRESYRKQAESQVVRERTMRQAHLAMTIDQMRRVAELSDAQVAKLQIAAKGAVDHSLQDLREQLDRYYESRIKAAAGGVRVAVTMNARRGANVAADEEIWTKTLGKVLSQEQRQQYDAAVAQRAAFRRQFLVQSVIAAIDEKVLLTEQQRQQLAEAVEASLDGDSQTAIGNSMMNGIRRYALQLVSRVDDEKLKAILSEHQVKGLSSNTGVVHQIRANAVLVKPR
jgi:hypothetical protein